VRAEIHLAAGAIAAAFLLACIGGAVASADPADSPGTENTNSTTSDTGPATAERSGGVEADKAVESQGADPKDLAREQQSADEHTQEKPADHDPGTGDCPGDKTISRVPPRPEAPPPRNLGPLPEPPLAPGLEAPPPADLPPLTPATPADPDPLGSVPGEGEHRPGGYEPPVLTLPVLVAPAPVSPVHILGTSIAPRWTPGGRPVEASWPAGEPSPRLLRASAYDPATRDPMLTSSGVTAPGQPYRTGFNDYSPRPLAQMAAGALPGVAGLATATAFGICLGYRQAKSAQQLRISGVDRFAD